MLTTNTISSTSGSRKKSKRLWRWNGSGKWTFSGRWMNGQNCRSGWWVPDWFEGGQTPLFRRMPKLKGFSNARFTKKYSVINLSDVEYAVSKWAKEITKESLIETWIITRKNLPVKLLANWEIKTKVDIKVDSISWSAQKAVEKVWGTVTLTSLQA